MSGRMRWDRLQPTKTSLLIKYICFFKTLFVKTIFQNCLFLGSKLHIFRFLISGRRRRDQLQPTQPIPDLPPIDQPGKRCIHMICIWMWYKCMYKYQFYMTTSVFGSSLWFKFSTSHSQHCCSSLNLKICKMRFKLALTPFKTKNICQNWSPRNLGIR